MGEKGFCSITVILITASIALAGSFFLLFAKTELATAKDFCSGIIAENAAQAGIYDVLVKLNNKKDGENANFWSENSILYREVIMEHNGKYTVYLIQQNAQVITLLSIGEYEEAKRQVIAYLNVNENKEVFLDHWSDQ